MHFVRRLFSEQVRYATLDQGLVWSVSVPEQIGTLKSALTLLTCALPGISESVRVENNGLPNFPFPNTTFPSSITVNVPKRTCGLWCSSVEHSPSNLLRSKLGTRIPVTQHEDQQCQSCLRQCLTVLSPRSRLLEDRAATVLIRDT